MKAKQDAKNDSPSKSKECALSDHKRTVETLARPQRRVSRILLTLGFLILATMVVVVMLRGWPLFDRMDAKKLSGQPPSEPSQSLSGEPVIPLEILFPKGLIGSLQNEGSGGNISSVKAPLGLPEEGRSSLVSPDALVESLPAIPATSQAVIAETRRVAENLTQRYPNDPDSLEIAARMLLWLGDGDQATLAWQRCLVLNSSYGYAHEGLGILAAKRGELDEAVALYRKALGNSQDAPGGLGTRVRLATVLIDRGQLEEAIELLQGDAQLPVIPTEVLVLLGLAHLQSKHYAEARQFYEAAIAGYPMHANAQFGLATACRRLGDADGAARHMERFQELRAGERNVRTDERSQYDDVQEMRERLARMHSNAGRLCHAHKDLKEAERHWRRAAALDPKAIECRQAVAWFCQQGGRPDDAIAMLRELGEIEPDNPAYLLEVGRLETILGRYDEAEKAFQAVCDRMPDCADGHASLARLYLRTERHADRVAELASSAAGLEPTVKNLLLHAVACERAGEIAGAATAMECVVRLDPNRPEYERMYQDLQKLLADSTMP